MREFVYLLPGPIVVCVLADTPTADGDDELGRCALCGQAIRVRSYWPGDWSLVCLLCFLVHADALDGAFVPDVATC